MAALVPPAVFFSYARADDEAERGRLSAIRRRLERELRVLTGEHWEVFQDNEDIEVGQQWRERIHHTVSGSTFFLPILTPTYIQRPICREELSLFLQKEKELGRNDLVIPLLYLATPVVTDARLAKNDPLTATLSRRHCDDWTQLRRHSLDSVKVRMRITGLAEAIVRARDSAVGRRNTSPSPPLLPFDDRDRSRAETEVAVDLGTANTRVYIKGRGIVLDEPSLAAVEADTHRVFLVGAAASKSTQRMPPNHITLRPLKGGVITEDVVATQMVESFLRKALGHGAPLARAIVAVSVGSTAVDKRVVKEVFTLAGVERVDLIPQPLAAASAIAASVGEHVTTCILHIGAGVSEVALIGRSGLLYAHSQPIAGDELDLAIVRYMKRAYNLFIGDRTAESIKLKVGSAFPRETKTNVEVRGRDLICGLPKTLTIESAEVREALLEPLSSIIDLLRTALEHCPPELAPDLVSGGIQLTGGGALLPGLDTLIGYETGLSVHVARNSLTAVAEGAGKALKQLDSAGPLFPPLRGIT